MDFKMSEKTSLLGHQGIQESLYGYDRSSATTILSWRHYMLAPVVFAAFLAEAIFSFILNEWTQSVIKNTYFPNTSSVHSNFSLCQYHNKSETEFTSYKEVQQKSAQWLIYFKLATYLPLIPASLLLPSYSDFYGRRKFIILGLVGCAIKICGSSYIIFADLELYYIFIPSVLNGMTGILGAVAFSSVADLTLGEKARVRGIVFLDFLFIGTNLVASPLSGLFVQTLGYGFSKTGAICSVLSLLALFVGSVTIPETLREDCRPKTQTVSSAMRKVFYFYTTQEFKSKRDSYIVLLIIFLFTSLTHGNRTQLETLYLLGQPFCWGPAYIGYFSLARHAATSFFGLAALNLMQRCMSHLCIAILSCLSNAGSFVVEGYARTDLMIYCAPIVGMLSFIMFPMLRGLMSTMTSPESQGSMFAVIAVLEVVGNLLSVGANEVYAASLTIMDGFVFLCMAALCFVDFCLLILYCFIQPQKVLGTKQ